MLSLPLRRSKSPVRGTTTLTEVFLFVTVTRALFRLTRVRNCTALMYSFLSSALRQLRLTQWRGTLKDSVRRTLRFPVDLFLDSGSQSADDDPKPNPDGGPNKLLELVS